MALTRPYRTARQLTYKGHVLETYSPRVGVWAGRVIDSPGLPYNDYYSTSRAKVLAELKSEITLALALRGAQS
jgi:hypothetical protein